MYIHTPVSPVKKNLRCCRWFEYDDQKVSVMDKKVLTSEKSHASAYILFYERSSCQTAPNE